MRLFCDCQLEIRIVVKPMFYESAKYIDLSLCFFYEKQYGTIAPMHVCTYNGFAVVFTKALDR